MGNRPYDPDFCDERHEKNEKEHEKFVTKDRFTFVEKLAYAIAALVAGIIGVALIRLVLTGGGVHI